MRLAARIAVAIAILAAVLAMVDCTGRFFRIDSCLDRGGRWDYDEDACDQAPTVPGLVPLQP
ncbi:MULTISPECIES: hypothetical protein [unclassified Massilia]|uniref:hypothetical protein n=1 Tax=unclassified Massilia TaxID=2609279 RepID=UPI001781B53C|nr:MULTISPECIES: hypothetical protein [unclassified Massilia]MBD8530820.1 hypothetical protein [Massilia sp. CFBP 13647]MBD8674519.1 hypothetical protein [Massilia sp. CFBP 13721]